MSVDEYFQTGRPVSARVRNHRLGGKDCNEPYAALKIMVSRAQGSPFPGADDASTGEYRAVEQSESAAESAVRVTSHLMSVSGDLWPPEHDNGGLHWEGRAGDGAWIATANGRWFKAAPIIEGEGRPVAVRPTLCAFPGVAPGTDLVARSTATGVLISAVLHDADASSDLRFLVTLPDVLALEPMPSGALDVVEEPVGATVGRLLRPWARDTLYRPVEARYLVDGPVVTLRLDHQDACHPVAASVQFTASTAARRTIAAPRPREAAPHPREAAASA